MIHAWFRQRWNEIVYFESGRWDTNEDKILKDHEKLVQLCIDGYKEISKKCVKEAFQKKI